MNNKPVTEYFFGELIGSVKAPLKIANAMKLFDITALVEGGGISSQADAVRHGISKALLEYDPELRSQLKKAGFLTRDSRVKEGKKYGLKRARRAPQWANVRSCFKYFFICSRVVSLGYKENHLAACCLLFLLLQVCHFYKPLPQVALCY